MTKKTDEQKFVKIMKDLGVPLSKLQGKSMIPDICWKKGARVTYGIGVRAPIDFYFTKKGKFIGIHGESINSFQAPKHD